MGTYRISRIHRGTIVGRVAYGSANHILSARAMARCCAVEWHAETWIETADGTLVERCYPLGIVA